jgi:uncharacterized membrane protein
MTSLTVWCYPTPLGVDAAELRLKQLEELGDITVHDLITVIWPAEADHPRVRRRKGRRRDVLHGTAWGTLLGAVLGGPLGGAAVGATAGAAHHRLRGAVMEDGVVTMLSEKIQPGTSAMFVLSSSANSAAVLAVLARDPDARLLHHESDTPAARELLDEIAERGTGGTGHTGKREFPRSG